MKKLLFVLAIGAFATACNDNTEKTSSTADSAMVVPMDTTVLPVDTTIVRVDSSAAVVLDSAATK